MITIKISNECFGGACCSKFFGEAFLPEEWLKSDEFSPTVIFFCQIDLSVASAYDDEGVLPKEGYLYFFMDFDVSPTKGIVRFSCSPDAATEFNEGAETDYDVETELKISFSRAEDGQNGLLCRHEKLFDNEICLLKFTPDSLPETDFLSGVDGALMFVIDKDKLKNLDFSQVSLINVK